MQEKFEKTCMGKFKNEYNSALTEKHLDKFLYLYIFI